MQERILETEEMDIHFFVSLFLFDIAEYLLVYEDSIFRRYCCKSIDGR